MIDFSTFTLKESTDINTLDNISAYTESSVELTFNFLTETKMEINNASQELYKGILEAETYEVVNESYSNFFTFIKEIIAKFIRFIKSLFDRFVTTLNRFIQSEKYLLKHEKDFSKFTPTMEFDFEGYHFTIDDPGIPMVECRAGFNSAFVGLNLAGIDGKSKEDQSAFIIDELDKAKYDIDEFIDKFRGEVIGKLNFPISESDFSNELFMVYRDGYDTTSSITVDASVINDSLINLKRYKEREKAVKKIKSKLESEYKSIERSLDRVVVRNRDNDLSKLIGIDIQGDYTSDSYKGIKVSEEVLTKLNAFFKAKVDQVEKMSSIHSLAFSYKLDAIKDCYIQDKKILYNALTRIQKGYGKGEII